MRQAVSARATRTLAVLREVAAERQRQDARWQGQNYPDGTDAELRNHAAEVRRHVQQRAAEGDLTWHDLLTEKFAEVTAKTDRVVLRGDLVRLAAAAVAWVEAIDRRRDREAGEALRRVNEALAGAVHVYSRERRGADERRAWCRCGWVGEWRGWGDVHADWLAHIEEAVTPEERGAAG